MMYWCLDCRKAIYDKKKLEEHKNHNIIEYDNHLNELQRIYVKAVDNIIDVIADKTVRGIIRYFKETNLFTEEVRKKAIEYLREQRYKGEIRDYDKVKCARCERVSNNYWRCVFIIKRFLREIKLILYVKDKELFLK